MEANRLELGAFSGIPKATFSTTHWSVVLRAGDGDSVTAQAALERLCETYWYPLYVFVRRKGHSPEDAQDLTQEFFARFLDKRYVQLADGSRGKFRTFLLSSLEHFLINEWAKASATKRGGSKPKVSWEEAGAEERYSHERVDGMAPDKLYEKRWAMSLLERVMERLHAEFATEQKDLFEALKPTVWGEPTDSSYQQIASTLGLTAGAVKIKAHRMRRQYRQLLRSEVANTVASTEDVDEELRFLAAVLRT